EPVEEGGARAADVQEAGRRGSEARDDLIGHAREGNERFRRRLRDPVPRVAAGTQNGGRLDEASRIWHIGARDENKRNHPKGGRTQRQASKGATSSATSSRPISRPAATRPW